MKWTDQQRAAIDARGENLLLSAAAGSGKTTVLVERVLSLIREGADMDDMLIVTFTRAAASDMRASLIRALEKAALTEPRFRPQAERAELAFIGTIHSFCTELLRAHFQKAGIDPAFRVADSAEAAILKNKALDAAMNEIYAADSDDLRALADGRSPDQVRDLAARLYDFIMTRPEPFRWLDGAVSDLQSGKDKWSASLTKAARRCLSDALTLARHARRLCREDDFLSPYLKTAEADCALIEQLMPLDYEPLQRELAALSLSRLPSVKGAGDDPRAQDYKSAREEIKKHLKKAAEKLPLALDGALADLPACASELRALSAIVRALHAEYTRLKDERSLLTFTDLEQRALSALEDDSVAEAVRERYAHIFVDEYQDVSDVQEAILVRISRGDNLFCVGDVKQSIYRFRGADPSLFQEKYARFRAGDGGRLVNLNSNFRSRANVLRFANAVFERAMDGGDAEILYDEDASLKPGAHYEGADPPVEIRLVSRTADLPEDESESESARLILDMKDAELEALIAARRIRELLGTDFYDAKQGCFRPLSYRDFVILTRQARDVAQPMLAVLKREGIPAYADVSGGYLDVVEVRVAVALLTLIENRRRDPEWIAVLRSPVANFSSEELARVRIRHPDGAFSDAAADYAQSVQDDAAARLRFLLRQLDRWRLYARALPLSALIFTVLRESNLYACAGALPGGTQRQANLDILCDRAAAYDAAQTGGLSGFLSHLELMNASREDMGEAHVLGENDDVVRIMTVHKSKGLEFPVVFGAMMGKPFSTRSAKGDIQLHRDAGVGLRHIDNRLGSARDTLPRLAAVERQRAESAAEELRILYVLLTRAKERLILTGCCADPEKLIKRSALSAEARLTPSCFWDVVMPAVLTMPGAEELRAGLPVGDSARVSVSVCSRASLSAAEGVDSERAAALFDSALASPPDPAFEAAYGWTYPYAGAVLLPLKLTASGLSRELTGPAQPPELTARPSFLSQDESAMTGAEKGTAAHAALQRLSLDRLRGLKEDGLRAEISGQLDELVQSGALTPAMRDAVPAARLARFFTDGPGARVLKSETVRREWMFTLKMSAGEALGIDSDESILVQGAIDCCFMEDGAWVLLDYKTDRADDEEALYRRYEPQLRLYARALERLTGLPVRETLICLLRSGHTLSLRQ